MNKCVNKPDKLREKIPEKTRLRLWVRSGGRCAHCRVHVRPPGEAQDWVYQVFLLDITDTGPPTDR